MVSLLFAGRGLFLAFDLRRQSQIAHQEQAVVNPLEQNDIGEITGHEDMISQVW